MVHYFMKYLNIYRYLSISKILDNDLKELIFEKRNSLD